MTIKKNLEINIMIGEKEYNTNSLLASSFNDNEDDLKRVQAKFYIRRWLKIS